MKGKNRGASNGMYGKTSWMKEKHHSKQSNIANSEKHKLLWKNEEYRAKQSSAHKGKPSYWIGKKFSYEHRMNLSLAHKGQKPWNYRKYDGERYETDLREPYNSN